MPEIFQDLTENTEKSISIPLSTRIEKLAVDIHFHGLTPLNHTETPTVE
jgi:hypothetical protein